MTAQTFQRVLAVVRHPLGGVRTHIVYTYPYLMEAGYRFTFVIPEHENHAPFLDDVASWEDVDIVQVGYRDRHRQKPAFRPAIRQLLKEQSCCLMHSHGVQAALPAMFANLGSIRVPHAMTSQDVFHRVGFSGPLDRLKLFGLGQLLRRLDAVIAVSEDTREDHLRHLPALRQGPCRVEMIHNGIPVHRFVDQSGDAPAHLRKRFGVGDDVTLLGFLGRFMEQKGFLVLVEALAKLVQQSDLQPFHLVAVGSGDYLVNYQRELEARPEVRRHVSFLDHTPNVAPLLRELDLLVIPSLWEAHPLLPMEAMLAGLPIVGTSCLGLREVLRGTPSKVVEPGDSSALAAGLREAIAHPWREAAENYVPVAQERFHVRETARHLLRLFDELLGGECEMAGNARRKVPERIRPTVQAREQRA